MLFVYIFAGLLVAAFVALVVIIINDFIQNKWE
jgi:hypothetical protein